MPLGLLGSAERAEVIEVKTGSRCADGRATITGAVRSCRDRIEDMGVRVGKIIEVLNNEGQGPILLKVDESRIALGRGMAMKILVRRTDK